MKAYHQGFSRFCSIFSLLNSIQVAGFPLSYSKAHLLVDDVVEQIGARDFTDIYLNGASVRRFLKVAKRFRRAMVKLFDIDLEITRPFAKMPDQPLNEILKYMDEVRNAKDAVLLNIEGKNFNHYTCYDHVKNNRMYLVDSDSMRSIAINNLTTENTFCTGSLCVLHTQEIFRIRLKSNVGAIS